MTLREIVSRLREYDNPEVVNIIYATPKGEAWEPDGIAAVVETPLYADENYVEPPGPDGTAYFLEVSLAQEAIEVYKEWRGDPQTTEEQDLAAVVYYAEHDAYLPLDQEPLSV